MLKHVLVLPCALALLLLVAPTAHADLIEPAGNLVDNWSFELPDLGGGKTWTVFDDVPDIEVPGWDTDVGRGIEIQANGVAGAPLDGSQLVELDSHPKPGSNSNMFQSLATTSGEAYLLSVWYTPRPSVNPATSSDIEVYWEGALLLTLGGTPQPQTVWSQTTRTVTAVGDGSTLLFKAVGKEDTLGGYLDAVSVIPVPEPATLALLGTGLAGLGVMRRRRRAA